MRRFAMRRPTAMIASPTSLGRPRIVMACIANGPTCAEMLTLACEKSWIWRSPVPALPTTCPATASGTAMVTVMRSTGSVGLRARILARGGRLAVDAGVGAGPLPLGEGWAVCRGWGAEGAVVGGGRGWRRRGRGSAAAISAAIAAMSSEERRAAMMIERGKVVSRVVARAREGCRR